MNPEITEPEAAAPTPNAVSIFGQGGSPNDFPVLKAFQEYIDAEQAKARKRMVGLSAFFIILLVVIVVTFTLVVMSVINRNQTLSDRLLDVALREKSPAQPVVNVQSPTPAPVVQPQSVDSAELVRLRNELQRQKEERQAEQAQRDKEKIDSLTAALAKAQQSVAPTPVVVTTSPAPVVQPAPESAELARLREELRREKEERKAEQEKAKEEKRKAEIEAHRRRLYPEYYAQQEALKAAAAARTEQTANPAESARPTETVGRAPRPLPTPVTKSDVESGSEPVPVTPVPQKPVVAPVAKPAPVRTPAVVSPPSPPAPQNKTVQPPSRLSSLPPEDPELKELLKNLKASEPTSKPAQPPATKPAALPATKPQPPAAKPAAQPVVKPQQPVAKPTPLPLSAPVQAQPVPQTETLAIGGGDGNSIPWLIEIPQN